MTIEAQAVTPTIRQTVRRVRFWIGVLVVLVAVVAIGALVNGSFRAGTTFDPDNAAPSGARALRSVLEQQGVRVAVTTRLADARGDSGTLLVDEADGLLPASAWRGLAAAHSRIVVVSPDLAAMEALLPAAREAGEPQGATATARCGLALARRAGAMALDHLTHSLRARGATVCFRDASGAGQLATAQRGTTRVILLADRTAFTNEYIAKSGNAAVALNALGATADLVWYRPSPLDLGSGSKTTLQDLTPAWVTPVAALLLLAGLAAALWRGRRLGPVVVESLPVVVRSRETVDGRARLYGRGRARLHAADALRIGTIGRIAPLLGLSRTASVEEVVVATARLTGRPRDAVAAVLLTADPGTDRDLVGVSDDLTRLEAAVRAATVPGATDHTRGST